MKYIYIYIHIYIYIYIYIYTVLGSASYQDGVNVDRLPSVDEIGKEMQAFPANTATRMDEGVDRRDDVLYFSI